MGARYGAKQKPNYVTVAKIRRALARLHLPDGITKPYRPVPNDFRERYIEMGWDGIDEHYGTNWRVIRRWIEIEGRAGLITARAEYVEQRRQERRERKRRAVGC